MPRPAWLTDERFYVMIEKQKQFYLTISADGYDEKTEHYALSSTLYRRHAPSYRIDKIELFPKLNTKMLDEVTVTATKVKMVMKGDTIEYNAAAFRMAEGSMLDNLIRALPGAELDNNGRITVNGEFVASLLVNGKDFFKGDPRVALSNLPAYTVNKIAVYHQADDMLKPKGLDSGAADPLVMDVRLKREYATGLISNYEAGLGSTLSGGAQVKWLGRFFAMRYTTVSSLAVYANANNLNDTRQAGDRGEWQKVDAGNGEITVKSAGVNFTRDWTPGKWSLNTSLQAERRNVDLTRETVSESYLDGGNTSARTRYADASNSTNLTWTADLHKKWDWGTLKVSPEAFYRHGSQAASGRSEKSNDADLFESAGASLLYRREVERTAVNDDWGVSVGGSFSMLSPLPFAAKYMLLNAYASYESAKLRSDAADIVSYPLSPSQDIDELQRSAAPTHGYRYGISAEPFSWVVKGGDNFAFSGDLSYGFEQRYDSDTRNLDRLDNHAAPSAQAEWVHDLANSYHTTRMTRRHSLQASAMFYLWKAQLQADVPIEFTNRRINDYRSATFNTRSVNDVAADVFVSLYNRDWSAPLGYKIKATVRQQLPDMLNLLDVRDDSNPLELHIGNPDLRKSTTYMVSAALTRQGLPHMRRWSFDINYQRSCNLLAMARTYDRQTGVTTIRPCNVNGNYEYWARLSYRRAIDRNDRLYFSSNFSPTFERNVDFSSDGTATALLKVNNIRLREMFTLSWDVGRATIRSKVDLRWNHLKSLSGVFEPFSYLDVSYGLSGSTPLVWGIDLQTDIMAYCRRGYDDPTMNTTDWVWNLQLSRAFGKRKQWVVKAIGFDLLQQLPNIRRMVNAQGRTETRYNTQPSYAMLTLTYRLDIQPRKK